MENTRQTDLPIPAFLLAWAASERRAGAERRPAVTLRIAREPMLAVIESDPVGCYARSREAVRS